MLQMLLAIAVIATVWHYTKAGGYYGGGDDGGHGNAQSFAQFQGPVVGLAQPVSVGHGQGQAGGYGGGGGHGNAQSFAQFQGPVVGPAQTVSAGYGHGHDHGHGHGHGQGQSIDYIVSITGGLHVPRHSDANRLGHTH